MIDGVVANVQQAYSIQKDTVDWKSRHATKLFTTFPTQGRVCSGTLIGTKTIITNAHCIYNSTYGGWATSMLVVPGLDGTYMPFGHASAAAFYVADTNWNENNDYGIVILDRHIGHPSMAGYLGYAWMSNSQWNNQYIEYYGYPTGVANSVSISSAASETTRAFRTFPATSLRGVGTKDTRPPPSAWCRLRLASSTCTSVVSTTTSGCSGTHPRAGLPAPSRGRPSAGQPVE